MPTNINDFDYVLPPERIAQRPAEPRETARLMVVHKKNGEREHTDIAHLPSYIHPGDVVVVNNTKVFHARLHGTLDSGARVEIFLVRPHQNGWLALGKPGKKLLPGVRVRIADNFNAVIREKHDDGTLLVDFSLPSGDVIKNADEFGEVPVPPYIKTLPKDSDYQTVYARKTGSVAAPTAGFHLTRAILDEIKQNGASILEVTLHVGLGTFLPVKTESLEAHAMHSEWANITDEAASEITAAKKEGRRIIAVGTTTVRTLEGVAALNAGAVVPFSGDIGLFIMPGFRFQVVDAMLTNFHLPKSTLIVLVSAFAGLRNIREAYEEAVLRSYRFYSFGDAMLII